MSLSAPILTLVGLATFELPARTLRLCDGGFVYVDGQKYTSSDDEFGAVETVETFGESLGDESPAGTLTFLPASTTAAGTLSSPDYQGARVTFHLAEVDPATGEVVGTPELLADMMLDTTELIIGRGSRRLEMNLISSAERLFLINEANTLSPRHHKSVWTGELGLDNATGKPTNVAWGVAGPPRGSTVAAVGGFIGALGGGGRFNTGRIDLPDA